jgi:hypothetical protein
MGFQHDLFGDSNVMSDNDAVKVLTGKNKTAATKEEKKYIRLLKQLNKLENTITNIKDQTPKIKLLYSQAVEPHLPILIDAHKQWINRFIFFLEGKGITKKEKEMALDLIDEKLTIIEEMGGEYDELRETILADYTSEADMFSEALNDFFSEENEDEEDFDGETSIESIIKQMEEQLSMMTGEAVDMEVDFEKLEGLNDKKKNEYLQELMLSALEKHKSGFSKKEQREFKKLRVNKEKADQFKNTDFGKLYKNLAKKVHPDLEQDPELKKVKEEFMKELVLAGENEDLFLLLKINEKFKNKTGEEGVLEGFSEKDLIPVLEYQINDLKVKVELETEMNPDSWFYDEFFDEKKGEINHKKIEQAKYEILNDSERIKEETIELKNKAVFKRKIKATIERHEAEADFLPSWLFD